MATRTQSQELRPTDDWPVFSARAMAAAYLLVCLLPLALAGVSRSAPLDPIEAIGAGLGLSGMAAMVVQVVTSGRFRHVSGGMGIDRIMAFHKIAAYWVLLVLLLHPLAYVLPTFLDDPARGVERLRAYLLLPDYRTGVAALLALVVLVVMGVARAVFRYEAWRGSHVILALIVLSAGMHHALTVGRLSSIGPLHWAWWAAAGVVVAAFAVLYGWRWFALLRRPWRLHAVNKKADRTWELDIEPVPGTSPLRYRAGQFVWMTEGARRFPLFDHPFSIASSPQREQLNLIIKEAGDFTRKIGDLAPGTLIGIDGPYGTFTLDRHHGDHVVLIAGGVGIAPIMGLLRDLVARRDPRPVRVAYAAGRPENMACLDEIEAAKTVLDLKVMLISEEPAEGWTNPTGLLDRGKLTELLGGLDPERTVVLMCGPGAMVTQVSDMLLDVGVPMNGIVYERFDYGGGLSARQDRQRTHAFLGLFMVLSVSVIGLSVLLF
ncbi:ferredoxin reductase family protein [Sediminimonas qiaohouensis]|uniref:ferredoxin reductase family protein n=1 Tax=Sediminimonas qiaohouensis TaxID=552061 RepID=UPI00041E445F|nr:ferric reductase-like transmembrane domain-containing protein [Sediminimonas qiaohouensis]